MEKFQTIGDVLRVNTFSDLSKLKTIVRTAIRVRDEMVRTLDSNSLEGFCILASRKLRNELLLEGIDSSTHMSKDHQYLVIDDHVVDITATQFPAFRNSPVVVLHLNDARMYDFYNTRYVIPQEVDKKIELGSHLWAHLALMQCAT